MPSESPAYRRRSYERLFLIERDRFARTFPRVRDARLHWLVGCSTIACATRDFAYADQARNIVSISLRVLEYPDANFLGLILHELGHLADDRINEPGAEARADRLAEQASGLRVYYDALDIETVMPGIWPRPAHLPR